VVVLGADTVGIVGVDTEIVGTFRLMRPIEGAGVVVLLAVLFPPPALETDVAEDDFVGLAE